VEDDLLWTESSVVDEEDEGGMGDNLLWSMEVVCG